jgi:hypothetical protein
MRDFSTWAFVLLGLWLMMEGIIRLTSFSPLGIIMGLLALAAGILLLVANLRGVRV